MNNREKIINAIEKAKRQSEEYAQDQIIVPFREADMILALLKEHEAKKVNISQTHCGMKYGLCPQCGKQIDTLVNPNYCGCCGQEVKW